MGSQVTHYSNLTGNVDDLGEGLPISGDAEAADAVEDRAEIRHRVRIRAALLLNGRNHDLSTENVSPRGVFLRSNDPVAPRQLVRLRLVLPPHDEVLVVPAMVVHAVDPDAASDGIVAGFGVRFVGLDGEPKDRWTRFMRYVDGLAAGGELTNLEVVSVAVDPELTPYRPLVDLAISVDSVEQLEALISEEVSRGRVLIPIDVPVPTATPVRVHLVHPMTQETFILDGTVSRWVRTPERGLATVDLVRLTHGMRRALSEFVTGIAFDSQVEMLDPPSTPTIDLETTREAPFFPAELLAEMRGPSESKTKLIPARRLEELCDVLLDEEIMFDPYDDKTTS